MQFGTSGKSRAGFAAVVFAVFLTGCGGSGGGSSSSGSSGSASTGNNVPSVDESVVAGQTVSLSWLAPVQRINGEQLSYTDDIDGYIVLYGQDPDNLDQRIVVDCQSVSCGYDVENLSSGTWYFAVQTVDSSGLISSPSEAVSRVI